MSGEPAEAGHTVNLPQESTRVGSSSVASEMPAEVGGSATMPQESRGVSPFAQEQGVGSKRPHPDEAKQRSGGSPPKGICHPMVLR